MRNHPAGSPIKFSLASRLKPPLESRDFFNGYGETAVEIGNAITQLLAFRKIPSLTVRPEVTQEAVKAYPDGCPYALAGHKRNLHVIWEAGIN